MPSFARWLLAIISGCLSAFILIIGFLSAKEVVDDQASAFGVLVLIIASLLSTNLFDVRREIKAVGRWLLGGVVFIPFLFILSHFVGQAQSNWRASSESLQTSKAVSDGGTGEVPPEDQKIFDEVMGK